MAIKVQMERVSGNLRVDQGTFDFKIGRALETFVIHEIGYGGRVIHLDEKSVKTYTPVLSHKDYVTLSGEKAEMELIVKTAAIHSLLFAQHDSEIYEAIAPAVIEVTKGIPLLVRSMGPIMIGTATSKIAFLAACDVDFEKIEFYKKFELKDIITAKTMELEGICSFDEALKL